MADATLLETEGSGTPRAHRLAVALALALGTILGIGALSQAFDAPRPALEAGPGGDWHGNVRTAR
ncbi:MAG: hypothetical protein KDG89_13415 [Geminicoccaceae bacterium]|nr:hypothetical protein [Geminicoccaceae bacterium]